MNIPDRGTTSAMDVVSLHTISCKTHMQISGWGRGSVTAEASAASARNAEWPVAVGGASENMSWRFRALFQPPYLQELQRDSLRQSGSLLLRFFKARSRESANISPRLHCDCCLIGGCCESPQEESVIVEGGGNFVEEAEQKAEACPSCCSCCCEGCLLQHSCHTPDFFSRAILAGKGCWTVLFYPFHECPVHLGQVADNF